MKNRRVVFVYSGGRESRWDSSTRSHDPSEFFYGAVEMEKAGWTVDVLDFNDDPSAISAKGIQAILGWSFPVRVRAEHLLGVMALKDRLRGADVVIATTSYLALSMGLLKSLGISLPPLVAIHCGIANHKPATRKRWVTSCLLAKQDSTFFAPAEARKTSEIFSIPGERVHPNAFGVDTAFWTPLDRPVVGDYILAVGNDARRDYSTMVAAAASWKLPVKILTKRKLPDDIPKNVEMISASWHSPAVTDSELRDLYRGAAVVVVPVVESIQPSGQSVALQAMSCGRPVVLSQTSGLWTEGDFLDREHLVLVPNGSVPALGEAVQSLIDQPNDATAMARRARARICDRGDINGFAHRLAAICNKATAWQEHDSAVG